MASVFERRARQFPLLVAVARQRPGKIIRGAEHPSLGDPRQMDAASVVELSQFFHHRGDVRASREARGDHRFLERFRGGEDQRLGDPHVLRRDAGRGGREQLRDIIRAGQYGPWSAFLRIGLSGDLS